MRLYIATLISALLLTACSLIEDPVRDCSDVEAPLDALMLSFEMHTSGSVISSRADSEHEEIRSEYRDFEDAIDFKDCAVFVFAGTGELTGAETLVYKKTDLGLSTDNDNSITGAYGNYTVNLTITRPRFKELTGIDVKPGGTDLIKFRILLLANCSSPGTSAAAKWNQIDGTTYSKVIEQLSAWRFAMGYIYNPSPASTAVTDIYNKKKAPMFGTNVFAATQQALIDSRPEDRLQLGSMDLLRAIAKVRVVDNIPGKNEAGYPKIAGATFISSQSEACQLPYNALTYQNGQQVHTPNLAAPDNELVYDGAPSYELGSIPDAWSITPASQRKGTTWIGYVPEQKIGAEATDALAGMPVFKVSVAMDENTVNLYEVPLTEYNDVTFTFGDYILRNHIYTLSVNGLQDSHPVVEVAVKDWRKIYYEYEY